LRLADDLNLDELDAARLFLESQEETETTGRTAYTISIIQFHQKRKYMLNCLRLMLQQAADVDLDEVLRMDMRGFIGEILRREASQASYVGKCLAAMADIKTWLQSLADRINSASVLDQRQQGDFEDLIEVQQRSLVEQHELLAVILFYLVKQDHAKLVDFQLVVNTLKRADRYDNLLRESIISY
jgi:nuclear pore complex protein Nup205